MRTRALIPAAALTLTIATAVLAQKHEHAAQHGGQFVEVEGEHGVELVVTPAALVFHLTDEGKPMDLSDAQFRAIVQTDSRTETIVLAVEGNVLKGALAAPLRAGAKIVISGKDRHGHPLQARFVQP